MKQKIRFLLLFILFGLISVYAQPVEVLNSSGIKLALKKLNTLGSVLYIAAHPDDENTALLSYLSTEKSFRTGYLSLTRGDGGQNLIGSEQGDLLGLIRTQELLQARKIDGAEQFFTRAFDFGFSKNPNETFKFWDKQKILSDVVWVIRKFRPDVIITRFPVSGEGGHGHHTASAILAEEAFNLSGTNAFPEQLKFVKPWTAKRLFHNGWLPTLQEKNADLSKFLTVDVGKFNFYLGKSYSEISAESRTMHKSQGFGSAGNRGELLNHFELRLGAPLKKDMFENIDFTWSKLKGAEKLQELLNRVEKVYSPAEPEKIIPILLQAYIELGKIKDDYWTELKKKELLKVIHSLMGLWFEATADDYSGVPGERINITGLIINRSSVSAKLKKIFINDQELDAAALLENEKPFKKVYSYTIPENMIFSQPFWLAKKHSNGTFIIDDQELIGKAENEPLVSVSSLVEVEGVELKFETPLIFRNVDQVKGEIFRPFEIIPPVTIQCDSKVLLFPDSGSKKVNISIQNNASSSEGTVHFNVPQGWKVSPEQFSFSLAKKQDEQTFVIIVTPSKEVKENPETSFLKVTAKVSGKEYSYSLNRIQYDHIQPQIYLAPSEIKIVRFDSRKTIDKIGYLMGAGDDIPSYLQQLGYNVTFLSESDFINDNLNSFDAVITGVRAYNTQLILLKAHKKLLHYVENGGNLLIQYNVNRPLHIHPGVYPFNISRERVTDETAGVSITNEQSNVLNYPNKIEKKDFNNWIQERGLYFADSWDEKYSTLLSSGDPGEKQLPGGLLYTKFGKGNFIYTGYSFFRQIPAGVPGAIRLFVNLFSAEK